jgi:hypothetical protein
MLELEGYQYDRTADFLTAQVARWENDELEPERTDLEVPINCRLRPLIDATMTLLSRAIAASEGRVRTDEQSSLTE